MSTGILGNMFDLNRDGDLDWMERAAELCSYRRFSMKTTRTMTTEE